MSNQATERAFEAYVEATLLERRDWQRGTTVEWDVVCAVSGAGLRVPGSDVAGIVGGDARAPYRGARRPG